MIRAGEGGRPCLGGLVYCPPGPGSIVCMALAPGRNSSLDLRRWNGHLTGDQAMGRTEPREGGSGMTCKPGSATGTGPDAPPNLPWLPSGAGQNRASSVRL